MTTVQDSFRGRNDDGSETTATWIAAANTNWTQLAGRTFRFRTLLRETAGADPSDDCQLQYNRNSAGWNDVNASSSVVRPAGSSNVGNNGTTTEQMAGPGTFEATGGSIDMGDDGRVFRTWSASRDIEDEFVLVIRLADVANGDTIQLREVVFGGAAFDTYTNTPTITVSMPPPTINYSGHQRPQIRDAAGPQTQFRT